MKKSSLLCILLLNLIMNSVKSQSNQPCHQEWMEDSVLEALSGQWIGSGQVGGEIVYYIVNNEWILNHQFMKISISDTTIPHQYQAEVFLGYDCDKNKYVIHWLDNFGGKMSQTLGYGTRKNNEITLQFDYPEGILTNVFSYDPQKKTWSMHLTTNNNEGMTLVFAHVEMKKKESH